MCDVALAQSWSTLTCEFTLWATCKPSWQRWPFQRTDNQEIPNVAIVCQQRFHYPLCLEKTYRCNQQYISSCTSQSFHKLPFWENIYMNCAVALLVGYISRDSFISTWHLHQSVLHLLFRKLQPLPPQIYGCFFLFFFLQLSASSHKVLPAF